TTGQKPFEGQGMTDISLKILHDEPTPPEILVEGFPDPLASLIQMTLQKKPTDRLASARALQVAIEELLVQSGIRCSSHDVAASVNDWFPNLRRRLDGPSLPRLDVSMPGDDVTNEPTMPMQRAAVVSPREDTERDLVAASSRVQVERPVDTWEERHRNLQG